MVEIVERKPIAILQIDPMLLLDEDGIVLPKIDILKNYNIDAIYDKKTRRKRPKKYYF